MPKKEHPGTSKVFELLSLEQLAAIQRRFPKTSTLVALNDKRES